MTIGRIATVVVTVALAAGLSAYIAMPPRTPAGSYDYEAFGRLLAQDGGRIKPLDTVARVALTVINHRQSCKDGTGQAMPPIKWLLEVMAMAPGDATGDVAKARIFRIENPQVVQQLGLDQRPGSWRYSFAELAPNEKRIDAEDRRIRKTDKRKRSQADEHMLTLSGHLEVFNRIYQWRLATIPPSGESADTQWLMPLQFRPEYLRLQAIHDVEIELRNEKIDPKTLTEEQIIRRAEQALSKLQTDVPQSAREFISIIDAYRQRNSERFNKLVAAYSTRYEDQISADTSRSNFEVVYNRAAPLYYGMWWYLAAFFLVVIGWIFVSWSPAAASRLFAAAYAVATWTFIVHTIALLARMYFMDRPFVFVTNLYSSAIFIGWCSVLIGLVVERIRGRGIGIAMTGIAGAASLIVAYFIDLGMEGDKLEMMQAVLDTNFWLATHVTTVTFGYAATFVAGFLGVAFILIGVMTPVLDRELTKTMSSLIYGVVCFATLLSFTGTVLGGIWADYSWGRFWGWDPKENGAMLIVLWNALILHARWSGLVKARGIAVLAVFGNIVTAWSWFGTNQLDFGLHSYGRTSAAATAVAVFDFVMLGVMLVGMLPETAWLSRHNKITSDLTS